ncbi:hypothetical protein [Allomuricauda sp. ARW1Y1]|jgi:hypothetical protein|uniref:hypothetical protein n=1 Tax=Allomuricauda sp. ARW1Y1 TaxID=2663843 RepID=UPI0015CBC528|nr:hypothetical protein [Muricauda sp. ARW1Y1]NYJ27508.1 hypothetical protein [Muricauda sp. ARW1Y1]
MHKIEVVGTKLVLEYPENGLEFSKEQFLAFSKYVLMYNSKVLSYDQFRTRLTYAFLNLKRSIDANDDKNLPAIENILSISKLANGFFSKKTQDGQKVVKMDFYRQLVPTIKANGKIFYGPSDALFNTVYGEFIDTLSHFNDYSTSGQIEHLDMMIATLYRPKRMFGWFRNLIGKYRLDKRREYNPELTAKYAKSLRGLNLHEKHAIYLYVSSSINFLLNAEALDIGGGNTLNIASIFEKPDGNQKGSGVGMLSTLYSIAETKVFGNINEVAKQNTIDVFAFLVDQKHKMKENEKRLKNANARRTRAVR